MNQIKDDIIIQAHHDIRIIYDKIELCVFMIEKKYLYSDELIQPYALFFHVKTMLCLQFFALNYVYS